MGRGGLGGCRGRGGGEGKAAAHAGLLSPNVQGFLMKMSTLLGIFQAPDVDLPLPASPTPPSLAQTASRRDADTKNCSLAGAGARRRAVVSTCSRPRASAQPAWEPPQPPSPRHRGPGPLAAWVPCVHLRGARGTGGEAPRAPEAVLGALLEKQKIDLFGVWLRRGVCSLPQPSPWQQSG